MAVTVPKWLDKSFLTLCLDGGLEPEKSSLEVSSFEVSSVLPPGNNYGANLMRAKVIYKMKGRSHHESIIVKCLTGYDEVTKIFEKLYEKEPSFYTEYLPEALKITGNLPVPKAYFSPIPDVIVLEDLSVECYKMADRCKMLDFDHCKLFFTASATFHATSVALHQERPEVVESVAVDPLYSKDLAESCVGLHKKMMTAGLLCMADRMERTEKYKRYAELVRKSTSDIWDKVANRHQQDYRLNVLQQADPWTPNMMFKYGESGKPASIKLLDFQATRYSSPLCSLVFFLWTSANHEVRENRLEQLYRIYCDHLNRELEELGCSERLPYEEFQENLKLLGPTILAVAAYFFPCMVSPRVIDMKKVVETLKDGGENPYDEFYDESFCGNHLIRILHQLETNGAFDLI